LGVKIPNQEVSIMGTNVSSAANLKLVGSSHTLIGIAGTYWSRDTQSARAFFEIPAGYQDTYTIQAVDSSGTVLGSLANGLTIST